MNQHKQPSDLHQGRGWLNRAAEMLDACEDHVSDAEFARAAAAIGNGFIALAHAERAMRSSATLDAAAERVRRAAAEARPHDDEPVNLCETDADMAARFAGQVGALTSRLDAVRAVLDRPWPDDEDHHDFVNDQLNAARAALRDDHAAGEATDRG